MAEDPFSDAQVRLRAMEPDDADVVHDLARDPELARLEGVVNLPTSKAATRRWIAEAADPGDDRAELLVATVDDTVLGRIAVVHADRRNGVLRHAIGLAAPYRRRGFGRSALRLLLDFYFGELGYEKAEAEVHASNQGSLAFHQALGFTVEGRRRSAVRSDGARQDVVLLGMTAEERGASS